jgi:hypothetical protein
MDARAQAAVAVVAQKRAKQAAGAARKLARLSAQLADGFDSYGSCEVDGPEDVESAAELIALAQRECGHVDVVLLVGSDRQTNHHGPRDGAKEEASAHTPEGLRPEQARGGAGEPSAVPR